jgi:hypothetical protein
MEVPVSFEVGDAETSEKNIKWKVTFNDEIRGIPIVVNGRLFVSAGDTLYVIQETEGKSTL